jgi:flagellar assembly protein FliH
MTSPEPRKFVFDTVFDAAGDVAHAAPPRPKRTYSADEVEQIRSSAYADGQQAQRAAAETLQALALRELSEAAVQALPTLAEVAHGHRAGSTELALACGRAIADAALDRFPEGPVRAALETLAREIEAAPRLVLTVRADLVGTLEGVVAETAQAIGYPGNIQLRAGDMVGAAFTLDFGDGAAAFDPAAAAERVQAALSAALAAEGLHAEPLIPSTGG